MMYPNLNIQYLDRTFNFPNMCLQNATEGRSEIDFFISNKSSLRVTKYSSCSPCLNKELLNAKLTDSSYFTHNKMS